MLPRPPTLTGLAPLGRPLPRAGEGNWWWESALRLAMFPLRLAYRGRAQARPLPPAGQESRLGGEGRSSQSLTRLACGSPPSPAAVAGRTPAHPPLPRAGEGVRG